MLNHIRTACRGIPITLRTEPSWLLILTASKVSAPLRWQVPLDRYGTRSLPARCSSEVIVDEVSSREVFERSREASGVERLEAQRKQRFFPRSLSGVEGLRALRAWILNPRARCALRVTLYSEARPREVFEPFVSVVPERRRGTQGPRSREVPTRREVTRPGSSTTAPPPLPTNTKSVC